MAVIYYYFILHWILINTPFQHCSVVCGRDTGWLKINYYEFTGAAVAAFFAAPFQLLSPLSRRQHQWHNERLSLAAGVQYITVITRCSFIN